MAASNYSGSVIYNNGYDRFGVPEPTNQGRFGYTGQLYLYEIGLYHYKARTYNPYIGRFMQTDPIGYEDGMNWYAYVGNDPMTMVDPTGMSECRSVNCITVRGQRPNRNVLTGRNAIDFVSSIQDGLGNPTNGYSNNESCESSEERVSSQNNSNKSFEDCVGDCIKDNYGATYDTADLLNPLSVTGLIGIEATDYLEDSLSRKANRNLYDDKKFKTGVRQAKTLAQFKVFNAASLVAGVGAFSFQLGALGYCTVECLNSD